LAVVLSKFMLRTARGIATAAMTSNAKAVAKSDAKVTSRRAESFEYSGCKESPRSIMVRYSPMITDPSRNSRAKIVITGKLMSASAIAFANL
jgi:hypothetical protein